MAPGTGTSHAGDGFVAGAGAGAGEHEQQEVQGSEETSSVRDSIAQRMWTSS